MSKVALFGDAGGTGTVTLAAPNTNSNVTLNLPATAGTMATAESTLTQFNVTGSAPVYACRAWVNFNGTGTVAIRASGNVSSITDLGTGRYTVNFTTAMPDANYAMVVSGGSFGVAAAMGFMYSPTTSGSNAEFVNANDVASDPVFGTVAVFR
jgi:hypothetical protein